MNKVYKVFEYVKLSGLLLSGFTIFVMMLFITADVVLRNIFKASLLGSYEITLYFLMPLAFFPGLAYTYSSGIMPKIEMFVEKLSKALQRRILLVLLVFELILFSLLTVYGLQYALTGTREQLGFSMQTNIIPYYPILYFVPLGFLLLSIEILFSIFRAFQSKPEKINVKNLNDVKL